MENDKLRKIAGKIFNYNPSSLKEEFACTVGPILSLLGLNNLMPNVSKPLSKKDISQKLEDGGFELSAENIIDLKPWYMERSSHMRSIARLNDGNYALGSYFFD